MQRIVLATLALVVLGAVPLDAQCRRIAGHRVCVHEDDRDAVEFGVRGGYDVEQDVATAGAQFRIPLVESLALEPSFDVFFEDLDAAPVDGVEWQANLDVLVRPEELGGLYVGGGLALARLQQADHDDVSTGTDAGWNALLGIEAGRVADTRLRPFAEGRWTGIDDYDAFRLVLGLNVPIGG